MRSLQLANGNTVIPYPMPDGTLVLAHLSPMGDVLALTRHVRTEAGARRYGLPIGSPIGGGGKPAAKAGKSLTVKHSGKSATFRRGEGGKSERRDGKAWRPSTADEAKLHAHAEKNGGKLPKTGADYVRAAEKARATREKNGTAKPTPPKPKAKAEGKAPEKAAAKAAPAPAGDKPADKPGAKTATISNGLAGQSAAERKTTIKALDDKQLADVDAEMARRAAALGKAGQVAPAHKAVKAELAKRGGDKPAAKAEAPKSMAELRARGAELQKQHAARKATATPEKTGQQELADNRAHRERLDRREAERRGEKAAPASSTKTPAAPKPVDRLKQQAKQDRQRIAAIRSAMKRGKRTA